MPDRRRRTATHLLPRERQSTDDSNPFAPPPEGRPDQPWQPRHRSGEGDGDDGGQDEGGSKEPGGRWSAHQPGRSSGGFGGNGGQGGQGGDGPGGNGPWGGGQGPGRPEGPQLRWDPTDPAQRRARYALLSGMWGFFFAVFRFQELALLLAALALYWGLSSLRARSKAPSPGGPAGRDTAGAGATAASGAAGPAAAARSQTTAAVSGIITASLALVIIASTLTLQLVYRDYYACVDDALTKDGRVACNELLPEPLRDYMGVPEE
ncbi:hypothetical protein BJP40_03030 [Streptomyces sp. CC53]|uniref:hypothetical protein n=1 Tax=unclassified Streptomyces TaxID=2593676 RepID=UPI0008DD31D7|nr:MULTISPECIES: hypothetical protein [unclassified Streptomyces]OII63205.1 hypothetical protein BJP40_03030 [Streptomyces sp. CC53]